MTETNPTPEPDDVRTAPMRILERARDDQAAAVDRVDEEIAKLDAKRDERWAFRERSVSRLEELDDAIDTLRGMAEATKQYEETL